jgi:type IV secretion system protein TrbL
MDIINTAINNYNNIFAGYLNQFLEWGKWLFYSCAVISIVWLCLWKAFDSDSFQNAMADFIKEFFVITLFYTIMLNAGPWLYSIVNTAASMGTTLAQQKVDPSSIITQGFAIANSLLAAANNTSFLVNGFSILIAGISYVVILCVFFAVALNLAVTIILNSLLISFASMSLAFAVFPITRSAARKTLDLIVANSVKLLVLYAVIAAGNGMISKIAEYIPTDKITSFDIFGWVVVSCLLFWAVAQYIPKNIAKIFTAMLQETHFVEAATFSGINPSVTMETSLPTDTLAIDVAQIKTAKINVAAAKYDTDRSFAKNWGIREGADSVYGSLSEHFKYIASKAKITEKNNDES